jgi:hypothetical protein
MPLLLYEAMKMDSEDQTNYADIISFLMGELREFSGYDYDWKVVSESFRNKILELSASQQSNLFRLLDDEYELSRHRTEQVRFVRLGMLTVVPGPSLPKTSSCHL